MKWKIHIRLVFLFGIWILQIIQYTDANANSINDNDVKEIDHLLYRSNQFVYDLGKSLKNLSESTSTNQLTLTCLDQLKYKAYQFKADLQGLAIDSRIVIQMQTQADKEAALLGYKYWYSNIIGNMPITKSTLSELQTICQKSNVFIAKSEEFFRLLLEIEISLNQIAERENIKTFD